MRTAARTMPLPPIGGIGNAYRDELVGLMSDLLSTADLDSDVALAVYQLKRALAGAGSRDDVIVPFIAPPLVPELSDDAEPVAA